MTKTILHTLLHSRKKFVFNSIQRNIDMDHLGKAFVPNPPAHLHPNTTPHMVPAQKAALQLSQSLILCDIRKQIVLHNHGPDLELVFFGLLQRTLMPSNH